MSISYVERLELSFAPKPWPAADAFRSEIDAHFKRERTKNPALWNGRLLLMHEFEFFGSTFRGSYFDTDFASLLAWRDGCFADSTIRNCFAQAALQGSDGGFVLGVMADHTANAGQVYFPSGSPDRADVVGDVVDLDGSVARELHEETGLDVSEFDIDRGWHAVHRPPRLAMMKMMKAREPAEALRRRILQFIATEEQPELSDVVIVHGPQDVGPHVTDYAAAFLRHIWRS